MLQRVNLAKTCAAKASLSREIKDYTNQLE